eukprot:Nk52_evm7s348 gene=Nk52_evmTU7s348
MRFNGLVTQAVDFLQRMLYGANGKLPHATIADLGSSAGNSLGNYYDNNGDLVRMTGSMASNATLYGLLDQTSGLISSAYQMTSDLRRLLKTDDSKLHSTETTSSSSSGSTQPQILNSLLVNALIRSCPKIYDPTTGSQTTFDVGMKLDRLMQNFNVLLQQLSAHLFQFNEDVSTSHDDPQIQQLATQASSSSKPLQTKPVDFQFIRHYDAEKEALKIVSQNARAKKIQEVLAAEYSGLFGNRANLPQALTTSSGATTAPMSAYGLNPSYVPSYLRRRRRSRRGDEQLKEIEDEALSLPNRLRRRSASGGIDSGSSGDDDISTLETVNSQQAARKIYEDAENRKKQLFNTYSAVVALRKGIQQALSDSPEAIVKESLSDQLGNALGLVEQLLGYNHEDGTSTTGPNGRPNPYNQANADKGAQNVLDRGQSMNRQARKMYEYLGMTSVKHYTRAAYYGVATFANLTSGYACPDAAMLNTGTLQSTEQVGITWGLNADTGQLNERVFTLPRANPAGGASSGNSLYMNEMARRGRGEGRGIENVSSPSNSESIKQRRRRRRRRRGDDDGRNMNEQNNKSESLRNIVLEATSRARRAPLTSTSREQKQRLLEAEAVARLDQKVFQNAVLASQDPTNLVDCSTGRRQLLEAILADLRVLGQCAVKYLDENPSPSPMHYPKSYMGAVTNMQKQAFPLVVDDSEWSEDSNPTDFNNPYQSAYNTYV